MDNQEKLTIFGTYGTGRRQNKYYTETLKDEIRTNPHQQPDMNQGALGVNE